MKKLYIIGLFLSIFFCVSTYAQVNGNGYYRVYNYGVSVKGNTSGVKEDAYVNVLHNKGKIIIQSASADLHSIRLIPNLETSLSLPSSVLYLRNKGSNKYDIESQGTSVSEIISYVPELIGYTSPDRYEIKATYYGQTEYLYSRNRSSNSMYSLLTSGTGLTVEYKQWIVKPICETGDNYFGLAPTLTVGDKYYAPFYASFPFKFASTGMKAYTVNGVNADGDIEISPIESDEIPGGVPMIIECSSKNTADNRLQLLESSSAVVNDNVLSGTFFCFDYATEDADMYTKRIEFNPENMRTWNVESGKLVLSTARDNLHKSTAAAEAESTAMYINANTSYLDIDALSTLLAGKKSATEIAEMQKVMKSKTTLGIVVADGIQNVYADDVTAEPQHYYTIDGKHIAQPQHGVNIVKYSNGLVRKVVVE